MVNASLNWVSLTGILLALVSLPAALAAGLQVVLVLRRRQGRSGAVILAVVLRLLVLLYRLVMLPLIAGILFFQGWRLDPILQFGVFLICLGYLGELTINGTADYLSWRQRRSQRAQLP